MAHHDARYNVDDGSSGRQRPQQYSHQQHPLPPRPGSSKDEHRDSSSSYNSYNTNTNYNNYNERRDDRQYPARCEDTRAPLPQRPDDRHRHGNHYQNERRDWNAPEEHRIPPPRENRWQNDRFHEQEQEHGYGEGSSSGLIRFPSSDQQYQQQQQHPQQGYKQGSERHSRRDYDDRQDPRLLSPPGEYPRDASAEVQDRPRRRPRTAPNQSVILIGIPPMCDSDDVRSFVDEFKQDSSDPSPVEEVTIVMDKQTGLSKRFGFVRFITLEHARAFVEANYDHVFWRSRGSHDIVEDGIKIRVDYASDDRRPGDLKPRKREYDQVAREDRPPVIMNDGSKDMGSTPNNILLLRNLDPLTNETHIAAKLENLDDAARTRTKNAQGPKRIILIKDRESNASWCFAFAVFPDDESAKAALRTILDPNAFPRGFTIQEHLVAVTFARVGCFTKAYAKTTWSFPHEGPDGKTHEHSYWDDGAYGLLYDCTAYKNAQAAKEAETGNADDVDAFLNSLAGEGVGLRNEEEVVQAPPSINLSVSGMAGLAGHATKERKKPTELIVSRKIAVDINKWNQKKAEVTVPEPPSAQNSAPATSIPAKAKTVPFSGQTETVSPLSDLDTSALDFADLSDTNLPKCLLCQRQFKSIEVLQKHSRQSELHQTNLKDESKVNTAKEAISNIPSSSTAAGAASQYRDRALERRSALNQPDHPPPPSKRHKGILPVNSVKAVRSAPEKEIEETNIGSKLLAGMGWTSGSGLGSSAAGRAAPVQAKAFASGAGIGASQGINASEKASETWGGKDFGRMKAAQRMAESQKRQP